MAYEILGIGNLLMDFIIQIDEAYLHALAGIKGGMETIDYQTIMQIIGKNPVSQQTPGGSATNTVKGLAQLGKRCALVGKIGKDRIGQQLIEVLSDIGIQTFFSISEQPTGMAACLITPDGERTFRTYVGPMTTFTPDELKPCYFEGVKLVYLEGYNFLYPGVIEKAMELAKEAGAKVAMDVSSVEMASSFQSKIIELLPRYVDILFANEQESIALTHLPPKKGCNILKDLCETVVIHSPEGCWIGQRQFETFASHIPIIPLDSTGAGDAFTSGFLYGYLSGHSLKESALLGMNAGKAVVQILGAELSSESWHQIKINSL
ncbi:MULTISPECIES: adenosine kinase [Parachlamydia]|jgi:sugar/nucleoside kinase (ribokinase family)|uniref:adenosine kinase n=1 Tax=Parachlamydia TaxID=83551 RepID=UPI0001C17B63|nr:adenosine kinase [Parachlamydia acanthamoebae]EFB42673.1 hypothetical protein pah_c004o220 [Parachlamydia acanthamoebae str. Hall's coccus]